MNAEHTSTEAHTTPVRQVIRIDEGQLHKHLDQVVRDSDQETLNALLDPEADRLCNAKQSGLIRFAETVGGRPLAVGETPDTPAR